MRLVPHCFGRALECALDRTDLVCVPFYSICSSAKMVGDLVGSHRFGRVVILVWMDIGICDRLFYERRDLFSLPICEASCLKWMAFLLYLAEMFLKPISLSNLQRLSWERRSPG